ncbi:MAG: hypothetical protein Q8O38_11015 [Sulfurimicrobium sp.]|nr:hypothetical protein [Sulfurimicrobium sp.]
MRLVLRIFLVVALGWGFAKLIELSPPQWKALATWLPPALITLLVAFAFGRSLFRGEALITRIARAHHEGGLPDDLIGYTRRLTALWAFFLLGCAILTMLLVQYANFPQAASLTPVLVPCLMIGEYFFRKHYFSQHSHRNPLSLMLFMLLHGMPRE